MKFMSRWTLAGGLILLGPLLAYPAFAHGTGYRRSEINPVSLEFYYSTGETMSYLEAKVFSPRDENFAFQSGRTDEAGRFAFTPDAPGRWRVVARDGEGHMAEAAIDVTEDFLKEASSGGLSLPKSGPPERAELFVRAALGVSLLFNIAACVSLRRRTVRDDAHQ